MITSGPIQGKYLYERVNLDSPTQLKKCSTVLGQSYIEDKDPVFLINAELNLNALTAPEGAYDLLKRGATYCKGYSRIY